MRRHPPEDDPLGLFSAPRWHAAPGPELHSSTGPEVIAAAQRRAVARAVRELGDAATDEAVSRRCCLPVWSVRCRRRELAGLPANPPKVRQARLARRREAVLAAVARHLTEHGPSTLGELAVALNYKPKSLHKLVSYSTNPLRRVGTRQPPRGGPVAVWGLR